MELFDIADTIEESAGALEQISQLIIIVMTEVFDECKGEEGNYLGKLMPYEHSFESVLTCAACLAQNQQKSLKEAATALYQLSKSDTAA